MRPRRKTSVLTVGHLVMIGLLGIPLISVAQFDRCEFLEVAFDDGILPTSTARTYTGTVTVTVSGIGHAAAGQALSDAFYVYRDENANEPDPPPYRDVYYNWVLWINGGPAHDSILIPAYEPSHVYTFEMLGTGQALTFAVGDTITGDNWGTYEVRACASSISLDWWQVDTPSVVNRWSAPLAFDSERGVTVMFGGRLVSPCCEAVAETWEFDGDSWSQISTDHSPEARIWHAMAFDSSRGMMVLWGGLDPDLGIEYNDTWEYDGGDWTEITTFDSPPTWPSAPMVFDSVRSTVVLLTDETWEYDGNNWTRIATSTSPPDRSLTAMAFDPFRERVILFGSGVVFEPNQPDTSTWEYDGTDWVRLNTPNSPGGRWAHSMVFDDARNRVVLFGGYGPTLPSGSQLDDTWEFNGTDWTEVATPMTPGAREQHGMTFDSRRGRVLVFGGVGMTAGDDTWSYPYPIEWIFSDGLESGDFGDWIVFPPPGP